MTKRMAIWLLIVVFVPVMTAASQDGEPKANYYFVDFYGKGPLKVGDVVTAYDEDGILSGKYVVETEGQYGFMHAYGDDPTTPDVDEGADPGSNMLFKINGVPVNTVGPDKPIWTGKFGDRLQVDLD